MKINKKINKPKFSIIIGTFNCKKYLKLAILSVLNQSFKDFELIIVDDASSDGSQKLIKDFSKKDKRIRPFFRNINSGKDSTPRNFGISKANGNYLCFLDSDDLWTEDKLYIQNSKLRSDTIMICTACKYIDTSGKKHSSFFIHFLRKFLQKKFFKSVHRNFYMYNPVIFSSVLIKTEIIKKNLFNEDPNLIGIVDLELWLRMFTEPKNANKIIFINEDLVKIRRREDSLNRNYKRAQIRAIHCVTEHFIKKNNFKYTHIFLFGIALKAIKAVINYSYKKLQKIALSLIISITAIFFLIFYSPLFWYLGKPLLYNNNPNEYKSYKNIVVFSGHGNTSYYNQTYQYRYKDILKLSSSLEDIDNIFILGRLYEIPEQRIIRELLVSDGFDQKKLKIIYKEYDNSKKNIESISKILKEENISNIIFITSPYHTKRAKLLWSKVPGVKVKLFKSVNWPKKNSFFEYSKNKKIIIYEYLSIIYNKLKGNI